MSPKVSIIIPVYTVADYIEDCMTTICQQTFRDFELIIVDDCGTDNSVDLALATLIKGGLESVVLRHEHNRGLSAARNTGLDAARGEYVLFVDSDDRVEPRCLELLVAQADKTRADMTFGNFTTFGDREQMHCQTSKPYVMAWNKLCRRSFLIDNNIRFVEGLLHEDCPWSFEIECKAKLISWIPEVTYLYLIRRSGLQIAGEFERHFNAYCQILKLYVKIMEECRGNLQLPMKQIIGWFETQKALYFGATEESGTADQLRQIYHLIRNLGPRPKFSKVDSHYWLPEALGFVLYKKYHRYHFC